MTYIYNRTENVLVEKAKTDLLPMMPGLPSDIYTEALREYEATLKCIPCAEICRGVWIDGQEVEEGLFEVKKDNISDCEEDPCTCTSDERWSCITTQSNFCDRMVAYPIQQEDESALWETISSEAYEIWKDRGALSSWDGWYINYLENNYKAPVKIKRKQ